MISFRGGVKFFGGVDHRGDGDGGVRNEPPIPGEREVREGTGIAALLVGI